MRRPEEGALLRRCGVCTRSLCNPPPPVAAAVGLWAVQGVRAEPAAAVQGRDPRLHVRGMMAAAVVVDPGDVAARGRAACVQATQRTLGWRARGGTLRQRPWAQGALLCDATGGCPGRCTCVRAGRQRCSSVRATTATWRVRGRARGSRAAGRARGPLLGGQAAAGGRQAGSPWSVRHCCCCLVPRAPPRRRVELRRGALHHVGGHVPLWRARERGERAGHCAGEAGASCCEQRPQGTRRRTRAPEFAKTLRPEGPQRRAAPPRGRSANANGGGALTVPYCAVCTALVPAAHQDGHVADARRRGAEPQLLGPAQGHPAGRPHAAHQHARAHGAPLVQAKPPRR